MTFPSNPTPGQTYTSHNTTWIYAGPVNGWYRAEVNPGNNSTFQTGGGGGVGVPVGGTSGQVLAKNSSTDYDTEWVDQTGGGSGTDLGYDAATRVLSSNTGDDVTLPLASTTTAGLQSSSDKTKLDGIEAGAQVNVATNLTYTANSRLLESSTGTDVTLPLVSSSDAGLAPASGGGTSNFLRADGTWASPSGGGGGGTPGGSSGQIQVNDGGVFAGFIELLWDKITKIFTVKGDIKLDDGGTFTTTIQMVTPTANRTISFPDATGTVGLVAGSSGQLVVNQSGAYAGATSITWDPTTGTRFANPFGYGTGAGGTVTQATSKSTGVTLNTRCGQITLNAAALAADTTVSFVLTNSSVAAGDVLILNHISGGTLGSYLLNARSAAGSATIDVRNITAGSLSEAVVIAFAIIKATTA